ncbi:heme ABC transporter ATP-binding protein CcmA [Photorhabdus luminescens]|uniref:cytochrome c biogenesis heme-transporting ATPase CcmA n=1 Tax=Photorhabdus akhurstii TaxID=171438 RepID=UPI000CF87DDB|nr:heme ABC transporter ATP-binding protein CcmA [Photorhabdus luminescens]PQQ27537.1 heme ABC transporter ATP-binding protein CcmA [Photorhabdus luminescens]
MLKAKKLTCIRHGRCLLHGLNINVLPGEIVNIEGPNGSGKTSLLRMLAGLVRPEGGRILWQGRDIQRQREYYHSQLLYLGHQPAVKSVLTVSENLVFYQRASSGLYDKNKIWQALEEISLNGYEEVPVAQLSSGQQRRVALARLWLSQAPLWILDEPLTAIDKQGIEKLTKLFTHHLSDGGMIIFSTHQNLPTELTTLRKIRLTVVEEELCSG